MILSTIFSVLFVSLIILLFIPHTNSKTVQIFSLSVSGLVLILSSCILSGFDFNQSLYQYVETFSLGLNILNIDFNFGLDGLSVYFFFLTALLIFLCVLFSWDSDKNKEHAFNLILLELLLLLVFSVLDLLLFYVFFEAILIPMFFLVGFLGSRARKIRAAFLLFFYTLFGSLLMLIGLIYIYSKVGSLNMEYICSFNFTEFEQKCLWIAFFFILCVKNTHVPFSHLVTRSTRRSTNNRFSAARRYTFETRCIWFFKI